MAEFESIYQGEDELEDIRAKLKDLEAQIAANNPRNLAGIREKELRALTRANFFGDGSDGDITLDGTTDFTDWSSRSGTTYTLTRDVFFNNLTVKSGVTVKNGGFYIFIKEDLVNRGTVSAAGGDGGDGNSGDGTGTVSDGKGGDAGAAAYTGTTNLPTMLPGQAGGDGGKKNNNGNDGGDGVNDTHALGDDGVAGGDGGEQSTGSRVNGDGGAAGTVTGVTRYPKVYTWALLMEDSDGSDYATSASSGAGGGGSSENSNSSGGGGGGSGAPGGILFIAAQRIINESTITAKGGDGGDGGNGGGSGASAGGGGGGGAGSGGVIVLIYGNKSGAGDENVSGGTKGSAGNNTAGYDTAPTDGVDGNDGVLYEIELG